MGDQGSLGKLEKALLEAEILDFYQCDLPKTFSIFRNHLSKSDQVELRRLSKLLTLWCNPHPYGLLFDGETNVKLDGEHLHFELKECQRHPDLLRAAMLVVMNSIWKEIKERFPKRSIIAIDECHTVIRPSGDGRANASARYVDDFFRQIRKFGGCCLAMSQAAKDLKTTEIGDGILANSPNRFILRQRGDEKTLREDLKLNEKEIKDAFSLSQVKGVYSEFYLHSEYIKGILIYRPTPLEYWLSTTHAPDNALLAKESAKLPNLNLSNLMDHMAAHFPNGAEGVAA
jgi:conjugal transfer ATP-binding protein TraC